MIDRGSQLAQTVGARPNRRLQLSPRFRRPALYDRPSHRLAASRPSLSQQLHGGRLRRRHLLRQCLAQLKRDSLGARPDGWLWTWDRVHAILVVSRQLPLRRDATR